MHPLLLLLIGAGAVAAVKSGNGSSTPVIDDQHPPISNMVYPWIPQRDPSVLTQPQEKGSNWAKPGIDITRTAQPDKMVAKNKPVPTFVRKNFRIAFNSSYPFTFGNAGPNGGGGSGGAGSGGSGGGRGQLK